MGKKATLKKLKKDSKKSKGRGKRKKSMPAEDTTVSLQLVEAAPEEAEQEVTEVVEEAAEAPAPETSEQETEQPTEEVAETEEASETAEVEQAEDPEAKSEESKVDIDAALEDDSEHDKETLKKMLENPKPIIEALLFSSSQPLTGKKIKQILRGAGIQNLPKLIEEINKDYEEKGAVWRIEQISGGYTMMTLPDFSPWIRKLITKKNDDKLSQAALESLAVVAYRQPITRAEVDAVRGVSSGSMLKTLIDKGLLRIAGQAEVPGRPLLYGTSQKFLDIFGLGSLKDLPKEQDSLVS